MTNDESKKPLYKNSAWIRCVVIGEVIVFGSLIFYRVLLWFVHTIVSFLMFPMIFWRIFQETFYPGNAEELMIYLFPVFVSLVLWWIFLGAVLGTVIYRIRLYLQRKSSNP